MGHLYKYRDDGTLDDQVIQTWKTTDGGTVSVYNPNLSPRDLTFLRHIIWMIHDVYLGSREEEEILRRVIHPLMFRNIKVEEVFHDFEDPKL